MYATFRGVNGLDCYRFDKSKTRSIEHLHSWIQTEHLLSELNESFLSSSMKDLLNLFGSDFKILKLLIKLSTQYQLKKVYNLLKKQHMKQLEQQLHITTVVTKKPSKSFDIISQESIEHILGYMNHRDVCKVKNSCRRIATVALKEMTKYEIGICNANALINAHVQNGRIQWNSKRYLNRYRCSQNTPHSELFQLVKKQHKIRIQNQICLTMTDPYYSDRLYDHKYKLSDRLPSPRQKISRHTSLIAFDKNNITKLELTNFHRMTENDTFDRESKSLLTILHFFDVDSQSMQIIQFLMIDLPMSSKRLMEYIRHELLPNINDNSLIQQLKSTLNGMDEEESQRLVLYSMRYNGWEATKVDCNENGHVFKSDSWYGWTAEPLSIVFQINPDSTNMIEKWRNDQITQLKTIYFKVSDFINMSKDRLCEIKLSSFQQIERVKSQIEAYIENESIDCSFDTLSEKLNVFNDGSEVVLEIDSKLDCQTLKKYICMKYFENIIDAENIEIYGEDKYQTFEPISTFQFYEQSLKFKLVPYDTQRGVGYEQCLYKIEIYIGEQCPFPYHRNNASDILSIDVIFKNICSPKELLEHIISEATHDLFYGMFSEVMYYYEDCDDWFLSRVSSDDNNKLYAPFEEALICSQSKTDSYKLFLIPSDDECREKKCRVLFVLDDTFDPNAEFALDEIYRKVIGLPLTVWLNEADTFQHVIDSEYVNKYKNEIVSSYRVNRVGEMDLIEKNDRDSHKIIREYYDCDAEFLVLTLAKNVNVETTKYCIQIADF